MTHPFVKTDGGRSVSARPKKNLNGDCTVRAVAVACEITFDQAMDALNPDGDGGSILWGQFQFDHVMANSTINGYRFEWIPFPAVKGQRRMNPETFAQQFTRGRYICQEAHHVCAWIDGTQYDKIPSYPGRCIYGAWRLVPVAGGNPVAIS